MTDLAEFKAAIDIHKVAELLTDVVRSGTHTVILCPFHDDHKPSCTLYDDGSFHCFVCRESGDAIDLVQQLRGCSFAEALDWLSEHTGVERPSRSPQQEALSAAMRELAEALADGRDAAPELPYGLTKAQAGELGLGRTDAERWNNCWMLPVARSTSAGYGALVSPPVVVSELPSYEQEFELEIPVAADPLFELAARVRGAAFAGLSVARLLIRKHKTLLYTPSVPEMLRLQADGQQGVVSAGRWPGNELATAMLELAPRVALILTPERARDERLLDSLFTLQHVGLRVDVVRLQADGLRPAVSAFDFLARLTPRMEAEAATICWNAFLESVPSATSRELYRQALAVQA